MRPNAHDATSGTSTKRSRTRVETFDFTRETIDAWHDDQGRHRNWPVVYTMNDSDSVYVGESLNAVSRFHQHLDAKAKNHLRAVRIVIDETFNKSVCLDLESFLIRMFSGDGRFQVLNRNDGVTNADYYERHRYQATFREIFDQLSADGLFAKRIPEIENSDLFKLSPFKALNEDQEAVIEDLVEGLLSDLAEDRLSTAVVEGGPGTGKTIVAIYLIKLLIDIQSGNDQDNPDAESVFSDFFLPDHRALLKGARIGLVVPQQSLRKSIQKVFAKTPGLSKDMVLTPYEVAKHAEPFDLLVVDETHRLTQYGAQAMGTLTASYREISQRLALPGEVWTELTQVDWLVRRSRHQVFLLDEGQGVRPIDVDGAALAQLRRDASMHDRSYGLSSQMRVRAGDDYTFFVRQLLAGVPARQYNDFGGYDLKFFDDFAAMRREILDRNQEFGLARVVAGYAWLWRSRNDPSAFDIEIDGIRMCWNRTDRDWINSPTSIDEVGSIHTVQGYDLNYAGVVIGRDLYFDPDEQRIKFNPANYFDTRGKARNNTLRGITHSVEDIAAMVKNAYSVLLTRGIRGTYVYVCDEALREHLRPYFPVAVSAEGGNQP